MLKDLDIQKLIDQFNRLSDRVIHDREIEGAWNQGLTTLVVVVGCVLAAYLVYKFSQKYL